MSIGEYDLLLKLFLLVENSAASTNPELYYSDATNER